MSATYTATLPDARYWQLRVPCQMACPVKTDCGKYVQLISEGRFEDAYLTSRSPNPLASQCGRICAAPCEDACRRKIVDKPVSIRALKRFVTEQYGIESRSPATWRKLQHGTEPGNKWAWHLPLLEGELLGVGDGRKVAVVGAGPAGLAAAHDLTLMGYDVTIFEATERGGGMAFHGIPEFRLPRGVLDKEIRMIEDMGVEIRYSTPLTAEFGVRQLREQGYAAVFIATGLPQGRMLRCPGSDLDGVIKAIDYLININNGYRVPRASKVLVLGGGLVAFDAARMAVRAGSALVDDLPEQHGGTMNTMLDAARIAARQGCEVTLACLESFAEMPACRTEQGKEEFEDSLREGIRFMPQRGIAALEGDGRVQRAHLIGVERTYDEDGRFAPVYDENIGEVIEADLVILAIGQQADLAFLAPDDNVQLTPQGTIQIDTATLATTARGIYAGGDVAFGPRNLIDGVADGKLAAQSIDQFLRGVPPAPAEFVFRFEKIPTRMYERLEDYDLIARQAPPTTDLGRRSGISEVEEAFSEEQARRQAERCLACHIQTVYDAEKCVLCNRCVDICPTHCLKLVPIEEVDLPAGVLPAANGETYSVMLKDDEACIRCGLCAIRCPTDAMTMEVMYYEQRT
jgi:NADPH-dependent glutamate synthase beta subunit-like oxidoreductase